MAREQEKLSKDVLAVLDKKGSVSNSVSGVSLQTF